MLFLIVGASGVLGGETMRRLLERGHRVRGMTRHVRRTRGLEDLGAEPVVADLTDRASLVRACDGVDRVFAAAHGLLGRGKNRSEAVDEAGHRSLIEVAREAGVDRFVYTSVLGAAPDHLVDFFRTKWLIEQDLATSGLAHVVLRPAAFMESHAHALNGKNILEKGRTVILGTGTKSRNFVSAQDVAEIAARVLTAEMPPSRVIAIAGSGNFTNDEVARLYAKNAGIPARIIHVPRLLLRTVGFAVQPIHPGLARVMQLSALADDAFSEAFTVADYRGYSEIGSTSLEAFVQERVREHRASAAPC